VFEKLHEAQVLKSAVASRHFGIALVALGIVMLVLGIGYHVSFMIGLRRERQAMKADGLIHAESQYPVSLTLMVALVLLVIGVVAIISMMFNVGPFD
jgi:putative membrane protein